MANLQDFGKQMYLENHGYTWDPRYEAYISRKDWKVFHRDYLDDHSFDALLSNLEEESQHGHWSIYVNSEAPIDIHNINKHYGLHS